MNKILNHFFDRFVFWNLKKISFGSLHLIDSKGNQYFFGDNNVLCNFFYISFFNDSRVSITYTLITEA